MIDRDVDEVDVRVFTTSMNNWYISMTAGGVGNGNITNCIVVVVSSSGYRRV